MRKPNTMRVLISTLGAAVIALALGGQTARAVTFSTPAGSTTSGGAVSATADITVGTNTVTVVLTNLGSNPKADSQLISGLEFKVSGSTGSASGLVGHGLDSTVDTSNGGSYTTGVDNGLPHWTLSSAVDLTTLSGAKPNELIIGPDNKGKLDPSFGGKYSNANSSISQHNPVVLGTATFTFTLSGVSSSSVISNVVFQFGTAKVPESVVGVAVPEPSSLAIAGLGGLGLLLYRGRRRRTV